MNASPDLTIVIPSRNEMFLARTIQDVLEHAELNTEVIAVLDGAWADPPIPDHERVTLIYHPVSIGQRAACNEAAAMARSKYVMKLDAHCSMAQGFDRVLLADMQDDWTVVPTMRNLWAFDWVCECGSRHYQGRAPTTCTGCDKPKYRRNKNWPHSGSKESYYVCLNCGRGVFQVKRPYECVGCGNPRYHREMIWIAKANPASTSYSFDTEPHFQYFDEFESRPEGIGDITPTMSLQGSCFMMTKAKWFELNVCDEAWGSWGSQGIEVAVKTWLSGGSVMVNRKTYYAHLFRTQGGDFGFPYPLPGSQAEHAKQQAREMFKAWDKAIHPLSWLVEKFWPVPYWMVEDLAELKQSEAING